MNAIITGKELHARILERDMVIFNQHSSDWNHVYNHPVDPFDTLKTAGCGIFSICHAVEWLTGRLLDPNELAEFSMNNAGRMYDGTNRPALLKAMQTSGMAQKNGFSYSYDEPGNDPDELYRHIVNRGVALCNLRKGHIVCLVAARTVKDVRQLLAVDSHPSCVSNVQYESILEVLNDCYIVYETKNSSGVVTGVSAQAAAFWVDVRSAFDYNLLYPLNKNEA